jgi:hypothetical protein
MKPLELDAPIDLPHGELPGSMVTAGKRRPATAANAARNRRRCIGHRC